MTMQEIFDNVVNHLLTQNARSYDSDRNCMYRGLSGMMCAVGCLIDDAAYLSEIEQLPVHSAEVNRVLESSGITVDEETEDLLLMLQRLHDGRMADGWVAFMVSIRGKLV